MMYLPYLSALKTRYTGITLSPSGDVVGVAIKNPQKGFTELKYPGIGIEYVTGSANRNRITTSRRVAKNLTDNTAIVREQLEPIDFMIYVHTFVQDSQAMDDLLQAYVLQRTPYYFAVNVVLADGTYNCEIQREDFDTVVIEGMDREIHQVYTLHVWGWIDPDPIGTARKLVSADPELRSMVGLDLTEIPVPPV
jgi:hypothetical protein